MKRHFRRLRPWVCVALGMLAVSVGSEASGQSPRLRYPAPQRPTLSPYLDLFRSDSGVLPPYHAFVRPRLAVQQQLSQQQQAISGLQTQVAPGGHGSQDPVSHRPTGIGGRFQSYLHFYDFGPSANSARR